MPIAPDTEKLLRDYLIDDQQRRARGATLDKLYDALMEHIQEDRDQLRELRRELTILAGKAAEAQRSAEDTGRHFIAEQLAERDRLRESMQWWRRNWIPTLVGIAGIVIAIVALFRH